MAISGACSAAAAGFLIGHSGTGAGIGLAIYNAAICVTGVFGKWPNER